MLRKKKKKSGFKVEFTQHARTRIQQRYPHQSETQMRRRVKSAVLHGVRLASKHSKTHRVEHDGHCYVFSKNFRNVVTIHPTAKQYPKKRKKKNNKQPKTVSHR